MHPPDTDLDDLDDLDDDAPAGNCHHDVGPGVTGVASGNLPTFTTSGITVNVGLGTITAFTAFASGPAVGACSAPFTSVTTPTPPNAYEHEPNGIVAESNPVSVAAGRSIRVGTFDWTGAACDLLDINIYLYPPTGQTGGGGPYRARISVLP